MSEALRVRSIAMHLSSGSSLANAPASPSCWVVQTSEQLVLLAAFFLLRNRLQGLEGAGEASCLVLGVLRGGGSGAARVLEAFAVELAAARAELGRLADRGVVPGPRPSDAELLSLLGIDLEAVRRRTEETFGGMALGWAIREATRARRGGVGRVPRTSLRDPPMLISQVLAHAGEQARALGVGAINSELLLGVVTDIQTSWPRCMRNRWTHQLHASVGLPAGYRGAAGPLLAALGVDLEELRSALLAELRAGVP